MAFLIDGHNLIGKIPWIDLAAADDELELIHILQEFARIRRKKVEVFFDQAPPGYTGRRSFGSITAVFVGRGNTADEAIHARLRSMGRAASNWTVVSSDHQVQSYARQHRAVVLSSEEFFKELRTALQSSQNNGHSGDRALSDKEMNYWLDLFNGDPKDKA